MDNIKYVTKEEVDEDKYSYAVCECTVIGTDYGIQVPRKKYNDFVEFKCPRCGRKLGLFVKGTDPNCDHSNMYDDINQIDLLNNLEVAKRILGNLNIPLDVMTRIHIGQVISEAINALKIVEKQRYV